MNGTVTAVSRSPEYSFSKPNADSITLLEGLGVEGDSHLGKTVRHRARGEAGPDRAELAAGSSDPCRVVR